MSAVWFEKLVGIDVAYGLGLGVPDSPIPYRRCRYPFNRRIVVWLIIAITNLTAYRAVL
jgi:hypothetical protein